MHMGQQRRELILRQRAARSTNKETEAKGPALWTKGWFEKKTRLNQENLEHVPVPAPT